jgi:hypothetical protein
MLDIVIVINNEMKLKEGRKRGKNKHPTLVKVTQQKVSFTSFIRSYPDIM